MGDKRQVTLKALITEVSQLKQVCEELLKWIKFEGKQNAIQIFKIELDDDTKKIIYELSNGMSSPDIASIVNVDSSTVRDHWHNWAENGMMEICQGYKRRYCRVFSLNELGIEIPDYEKEADKQKEE